MGELHKEYLLSDSIAKSVFATLLKPETFTDDTIEAALRFIEKVGPGIEERVKSEKKTFTLDDYNKILNDFKLALDMTEVEEGCTHLPSNRIKMLIKNMFENKALGWKKTKDKTELKTKEEIERQELKKVEEKAMQQQQARN